MPLFPLRGFSHLSPAGRQKRPLNTQAQALGRGDQKRPLGFSRPEVQSPRLSTHSPSSWCSPVRSGKPVRAGSGDRSVFGRPQAIKKRQGMPPATKGRTRRKHWGYQQHHPLQAGRGAVGVVNELRKKERSHPLPVRRIVPSPKGTGIR